MDVCKPGGAGTFPIVYIISEEHGQLDSLIYHREFNRLLRPYIKKLRFLPPGNPPQFTLQCTPLKHAKLSPFQPL